MGPLPTPGENDPLRKMGFNAALALIFVRFGVIPELLVTVLHVNTYLLYIVGPPALFACLITGGFGRAFRATATAAWTGFFVCMLIATPGSIWLGASVGLVMTYARTDLIMLYVIAGMLVTWEEVTKAFNALALAAFVIVLAARLYAQPDNSGRLALQLGFDGVISNSNDLAAHLVLMLPFILFLILKPGRNNLVRLLFLGCICYGLWVILATSSRGAMIGLGAVALFMFFRASGAQKAAVMVAIPLIVILLISVLPKANLARLATTFSSEPVVEGDEAGESAATRKALLMKSIKYTFEHPVLGIGPGQFSNFEGMMSKLEGKHSAWNETHNTYTGVSSECGIPALILVLVAFGGTFRLVSKTYKMARKLKDAEVVRVCFCYLTALVGYLVTIFFLACQYRFTLPALVGLGVSIHFAASRRFAASQAMAPDTAISAAHWGILGRATAYR